MPMAGVGFSLRLSHGKRSFQLFERGLVCAGGVEAIFTGWVTGSLTLAYALAISRRACLFIGTR